MVPVVNMGQHFDSPDLSMVSCGGQATIPIIAAVSRIASVQYSEIVCSIASKSAGPGTRANIDEFTQTTARAIELVGGPRHGKAVIVLNPAEPPIIMRNTPPPAASAVRSHWSDKPMLVDSIGAFTGIKISMIVDVVLDFAKERQTAELEPQPNV